jgi:hypothetical protein
MFHPACLAKQAKTGLPTFLKHFMEQVVAIGNMFNFSDRHIFHVHYFQKMLNIAKPQNEPTGQLSGSNFSGRRNMI